MRPTVEIEGIDELRRSLREISPAAARGMRLALNDAADHVIKKTQPKIPSRSGRARRSLKRRSTQTAVRIAVGGRAAPYYPWLDFGGKVGRGDSVVREYKADGRYIYPTLRESRPEFEKILAARLNEIARDAGLEVD